jgi:hypothetical protein
MDDRHSRSTEKYGVNGVTLTTEYVWTESRRKFRMEGYIASTMQMKVIAVENKISLMATSNSKSNVFMLYSSQ